MTSFYHKATAESCVLITSCYGYQLSWFLHQPPNSPCSLGYFLFSKLDNGMNCLVHYVCPYQWYVTLVLFCWVNWTPLWILGPDSNWRHCGSWSSIWAVLREATREEESRNMGARMACCMYLLTLINWNQRQAPCTVADSRRGPARAGILGCVRETLPASFLVVAGTAVRLSSN